MNNQIKIGVSSCLLGQEVRFDGGHKRSAYVDNTLGEYFEFVSYCPEMSIGLGIPRPTIRLIKRGNQVHLVDSKDETIDHTDKMKTASKNYCRQLTDISGYIFKSKSPSCGMERINLYNEKDFPEKTGVGIFAYELMKANPNLPVEEEGRLNDLHLRENFIERIFIYHRWQQMLQQGLTVNSLMNFHKTHKLILLAHDEERYRQLGPQVAQVNGENLQKTSEQYIATVMQMLKTHASHKKHMNVLQHMMGYLKREIDAKDKQDLLEVFEKYRIGQLPLIVPITLLKYHLRKHPQPYLQEQHYLFPYPEELMLRNHV